MYNQNEPEDEVPQPEEEKSSEENETEIEDSSDDEEIAEIDPEKDAELQESLDREAESLLAEEDEDEIEEEEIEEEEIVEEEIVEEESEKEASQDSSKEETKSESTEEKKSKGKKRRRKQKQPKIDLNKNPKIKRIVQESERLEDANELKELRDAHNDGTRDLINKIKKIQIEISNVRNQALDYRMKRDQLNKQVQEIKAKKTKLVEFLNDSRSALKKAKSDAKQSPEGQNSRKVGAQIGKIRRKIEFLEKQIETEDLDIHKENEIVDEIDKLERTLQELMKENRKPKQFKEEIDNIRKYRKELAEINDELRKSAEESQNYHLLYLDCSKEIDELRREKRNLQRELNENRYIADIYHQRLIEVSQRLNRRKRLTQKAQYQNKKKIKKEIQRLTLEDAKDKLKKGAKLNIFEARAFLEEKANKAEK
ncbi:MAG: hypothetical protein ACTSWC_02320 [Promethearchaeota archaeon]